MLVGGGEVGGVGGPGDGVDPTGVTGQCVDGLLGGGVPEVHGVVAAAGGDAGAVGGPGCRGDLAGVTVEGGGGVAGAGSTGVFRRRRRWR